MADAQTKLGDPGVVFIDIREARELEREGTIPGAFHAPRGMLEFWVDPESPYHKEVFGSDKQSARTQSSAPYHLLPICVAVGACDGNFG